MEERIKGIALSEEILIALNEADLNTIDYQDPPIIGSY